MRKKVGIPLSVLANFRVAFLERLSVQTSAVKSIKLVSDLRQGPSEKVVDFHDRVPLVIMTFGKDQKARYQTADLEHHEWLIDMIKMHFVGGLRPSIRELLCLSHR